MPLPADIDHALLPRSVPRAARSRSAAGLAVALLASCATALPAPDPDEFRTEFENNANLAFAPDGTSAYWSAWNGKWGAVDESPKRLLVSRLEEGAWSAPEVLKFSGEHSDDDPFVSPDGRWLYFVSNRPTAPDDDETDSNIWRYRLDGEPVLEALSINSSAEEYSPVVTASGNLYFASSREGGIGGGDLYRAVPSDTGFAPAEPLGNAVNSVHGEWNLWVSADEHEILFESSSRSTNVAVPGDLYYSWLSDSGWTPAIPVSSLNTRQSELMPRLHPDGETLYYLSGDFGKAAKIKMASWTTLRTRLREEFAPPLLVANRSSHEVTKVHLAQGGIVDRVPTGHGPHLLSNVSEGRVLASGYGEYPEPHSTPVPDRPPFASKINSRLTLIDTGTMSVLWDEAIGDCTQPHASWIDAGRGYVTCEPQEQVAVVDLENARVIERVATTQRGSHVLSFDERSRTLAASNVDSGSLTLIDTRNGHTRVVPLAAGSEGATAIDGMFWVGNAIDGSVSVVDPADGRIVGHLDSVCSFPISISRDVRGQVWIACFASRELVAVDPAEFSIERRIRLEHQPLHVLAHPARPFAYVSLPRQNAVAEIDLDAGREIRRIEVGIEPDGLRWVQ